MTESQILFEAACKIIPGGVNSPVRACQNVDMTPLFIKRGQGSHLFVEGGQEFIDYVMSWGPLLLGHNHPAVQTALHAAVDRGTSYGAPCAAEITLAQMIVDAIPSVEMVRMVNSGTEATMSALRLVRGYTGRNKIIKFHGGYHGHADAFLASAGSGLATQSIPGTPGIPKDVVRHTLLAHYNDLDAVKELFNLHGHDIAAIFVEPVAGNMGMVLPEKGFLQGLRDLTTAYGAVLVFDEVITGFRVAFNGAQSHFGITPDLTCLGKIIGGGLPVGAYGGKKEIMDHIAPSGNVYQAGTLSGNPLAMAAGLATLTALSTLDYSALAQKTKTFALELKKILQSKGVPVQLNHIASIFTLFFAENPVTNFTSSQQADQKLFVKYYQQMRNQGIYLAPSGFECSFTSFAHSDEDFTRTLEAADKVCF